MAAVRRSFYYYDIQTSDPSFVSRIMDILQLNENARGSFTQGGQQMLFEAAQRDNVWCGYATLLREDARPELGRRNSAVGTPINMGNNDGILERSHFVFSPRHSVLLFEYNTFGPRATAFLRCMDNLYQTHCNEQAPDVEWSYVPRGDALERIRRGQTIASVSFSTKPVTFARPQGGDTSIGSLLDDASELANPKKVGIALLGDKKRPVMTITDFFGKILGNHQPSDYEKLEVKVVNQSGYIDTIDLVKDHVHSSLSFIGMDNTRRINTEEAYTRMIHELQERYGEL